MNKPLIVVFALLGLSTIPACGSSSGGSSGGTTNGTCVPTSDFGNASDACKSCVESSCSSEYSALCSAGCTSSSSSSACTQAISSIGNCLASKCASQCEDATSAGGSSNNGTGGSDTTGGTSSASGGSENTSGGTGNASGGTSNVAGSSSASAGTGGAGTPTAPNCVTLETCCNTLPDNAKGACLQSAGFNNDGPCKNLLASYQAGGSCTGNGGTDGNHVVCYLSAMGICTKTFAPANYVAMYQMACQGEGGQTPDACPSDNLTGCCTIGSGNSASESCYYTTLADAPTASDCAQTTGTWSTTP